MKVFIFSPHAFIFNLLEIVNLKCKPIFSFIDIVLSHHDCNTVKYPYYKNKIMYYWVNLTLALTPSSQKPKVILHPLNHELYFSQNYYLANTIVLSFAVYPEVPLYHSSNHFPTILHHIQHKMLYLHVVLNELF